MSGFENINDELKKKYVVLKICIPSENNDLKRMYENQIEKHNRDVLNSVFPNSGFDLFVPEDVTFNQEIDSKFIDLGVQCEMVNHKDESLPFFLFPRSSISKTPLMLANHTGVIDSGYRGNMIAAFRWLNSQETHLPFYTVEKGLRLVQICHPGLKPVLAKLVNHHELSTTERGSAGFGSTGR